MTSRRAKATPALFVLLSALCSAAQGTGNAPRIPVDHFGPPVCTGGNIPAHRAVYETQKAEQAQGAELVHALPSAEPLENFGLQRIRLADYGDCVGAGGCYWADLDAQYRRAELALEAELVHRRPSEKLAIVMDIDETALSSYCEMKREDFGFIPAMSFPWVVSPDAAVAIPGALRLYRKARTAGVAVFFITGRPGMANRSATHPPLDQTSGTERNLRTAGFEGFAHLSLRNGDENGQPTIAYKTAERQKIVNSGYRLLMNVGDQWSDLLGSPQSEVSIKLPNPFYFVP